MCVGILRSLSLRLLTLVNNLQVLFSIPHFPLSTFKLYFASTEPYSLHDLANCQIHNLWQYFFTKLHSDFQLLFLLYLLHLCMMK